MVYVLNSFATAALLHSQGKCVSALIVDQASADDLYNLPNSLEVLIIKEFFRSDDFFNNGKFDRINNLPYSLNFFAILNNNLTADQLEVKLPYGCVGVIDYDNEWKDILKFSKELDDKKMMKGGTDKLFKKLCKWKANQHKYCAPSFTSKLGYARNNIITHALSKYNSNKKGIYYMVDMREYIEYCYNDYKYECGTEEEYEDEKVMPLNEYMDYQRLVIKMSMRHLNSFTQIFHHSGTIDEIYEWLYSKGNRKQRRPQILYSQRHDDYVKNGNIGHSIDSDYYTNLYM